MSADMWQPLWKLLTIFNNFYYLYTVFYYFYQLYLYIRAYSPYLEFYNWKYWILQQYFVIKGRVLVIMEDLKFWQFDSFIWECFESFVMVLEQFGLVLWIFYDLHELLEEL